MNTVFVSGTIKTPVQVKMNEKGYLITFDMMHCDQSMDDQGTMKQILTPWKVALSYKERPTQLLDKLSTGIKVLVKGDAKIDYEEIDQHYKLNCFLKGEQLNIFEGQTAKEGQYNNTSAPAWEEPTAMAS